MVNMFHCKPMIYIPSIKPCDRAVSMEPPQKIVFHVSFHFGGAFTRNSNATPRRIRPISMAATGR